MCLLLSFKPHNFWCYYMLSSFIIWVSTCSVFLLNIAPCSKHRSATTSSQSPKKVATSSTVLLSIFLRKVLRLHQIHRMDLDSHGDEGIGETFSKPGVSSFLVKSCEVTKSSLMGSGDRCLGIMKTLCLPDSKRTRATSQNLMKETLPRNKFRQRQQNKS